ncbi:MAG: HAMP domain-containing histidine kinase [Anaerolineales bacterium]|nr:HAMP domain-containing histidine kinase [Chloroflexota bacterium]MBL6979617.1 HAMP domain-containing histidine kinase [Anaerolineales bacterium]
MPFYVEFAFPGLLIIILALIAIPTLIISTWIFFNRSRRAQKHLRELGEYYAGSNRPVSRTEQAYLDFMRYISHEVSNPLQSILGGLANLRQVIGVDDPSEIYLDQIESDTQRLSRLTADLRMLAQLENPGLHIKLQPVQMRAVIASVIMSQADRAADQGIELTYHGPDHPPRVLANRDWITRVVENLVDNGLKYSRLGSREIIISISPTEVSLQVSVSDDGVGISDEMLPHIFDQAYRVPDARTNQRPGSGLGLPIVQRIVEQHGGAIQISSVFGQGSIVTFYLPKAPISETLEQEKDEFRDNGGISDYNHKNRQ